MPVVIDYLSEQFPSAYLANGSNQLTTTWDDILWAAITVGRPNRNYVFRHGTPSAYEALFRWSLTRMALEQRGPAGQRLWRTDAARTLDPSEKGAVSYFLGMTFCKLFAASLLDTPWLLHLDVFRPEINPVLTGRSRPDMVGKNSITGEWHAFECKGRASVPNEEAREKAKEQADRLIQVDGTDCELHIGAISYFRSDILHFYWRDPQPQRQKPIEVSKAESEWGHYYAPVIGLLERARLQQSFFNEESAFLPIEEADLKISIHPEVNARLMQGDALGAHQFCVEVGSQLVESGYKPDGIMIKAGDSWSRRYLEVGLEEGRDRN